jgi:glycosyltransferase involved in cell wall biosynthesis
MNILFVTQRVPAPPDRGDKIRAHHFARRLASRHQVHVACLLDGPSETVHIDDVRRWAASVTWRFRRPEESAIRGAAAALTGKPMTVGFFRSGGLAKEIETLMRRDRFDVVVAYCSSMANYVNGFVGAKVVDLVDVDSEKWKQYAERSSIPKRALYGLEHRLLRNYERRLVREFDRCILVSEAERQVLSRFADSQTVEVVANGVETEWWKRAVPRPRDPVLVFTGVLDYHANVDGIEYFARGGRCPSRALERRRGGRAVANRAGNPEQGAGGNGGRDTSCQ